MKSLVACAALLGLSLASAGAGAAAGSATDMAGFECLVDPSQTVELRTAVDGLIEKVNVRRADPVRKGQVLVELQSAAEEMAVESARFRAEMTGQITTARSRVVYAGKKFARFDELQREKMVSAQAADEANAELQLAQAELLAGTENRDLARIEHQRAVEQLALRTLRSPFDGIVVERMLNPGDLAESGSGRKPVLLLAQIDPLYIDVALPDRLFGTVAAGDKMAVDVRGPGGRYKVKVSFVDRVVDAASGTFLVRLELPNRKGQIPSGIRCVADFDPPRESLARALP
jgi:RND family efflux transporter MFP subunit